MKRILLATIVLLLASVGVGALHLKSSRTHQQLRSCQHGWQASTQRLAGLEITRTTLIEQVRELKREVHALEPNAASESPWMALLNTNGLAPLTPEMRERLLAELGASWHSSTQWLLVSKTTLASVRMGAIQQNRLTDAACAVLAVSPDERQRLDAALARVREAHADWARANTQREGPSGETVVRYTLPSDTAFAEGLTNDLFSAYAAALGPQRAALLERYSSDWVNLETGFLGGATNRLTVLRKTDSAGVARVFYALNRGAMTQGASPIQPSTHFPSEFRPVFPGGWPELARREGLDLPVGFVDRPPGNMGIRMEAVFPRVGPKP